MFSLNKNISGQDFIDLISVCFDHANIFSLSQNRWFDVVSERSAQLLQQLCPYYIKDLDTNRWFCHYVPKEFAYKVYLFRTVPEAKSIILSAYSKLFFDGTAWEEPENICFFRDNRLVLGSVSHEKICYLYDSELWRLLKKKDFWECVPDEANERIILPN